MSNQPRLPDPITFLQGLLPGNPFQGEPPLPRGLIALMEVSEEPPAIPETPAETKKPGCTAAETTILSLGFLDGLADGLGGFGVLRQGKEYLEKGAVAAESLGQADLAREMQSIAAELPSVRTEEEAGKLAERLRPLKRRSWQLGRECDKMLVWGTDAIIALAERVAQGELSLQEAKELLSDAP